MGEDAGRPRRRDADGEGARAQAVASRAAAAKVYAAETEEAAAAAVATQAAAGELGGATRDRELAELKLHSLQLLAPATMLRLLQDSCRELGSPTRRRSPPPSAR